MKILFLPAYSPELNPNEKVFAQVKNWLRYNRNTQLGLSLEVIKAFSRIKYEELVKYFKASNTLGALEQVC